MEKGIQNGVQLGEVNTNGINSGLETLYKEIVIPAVKQYLVLEESTNNCNLPDIIKMISPVAIAFLKEIGIVESDNTLYE